LYSTADFDYGEKFQSMILFQWGIFMDVWWLFLIKGKQNIKKKNLQTLTGN